MVFYSLKKMEEGFHITFEKLIIVSKFTVAPHKIQPNLRFTEMGALAEVLCNVNTEPTPPPPAAAVT